MQEQRLIKLALLGSALMLLPACASLRGSDEAASAVRADLPELPEHWASAAKNVGDADVGWIDSFNDPALTKLVAEAQAHNKNLAAAAANIDRARALAGQASAALAPQVNLVAGGAERGGLETSDSVTALNAGAQLNWELDVWGRLRAQRRAANFNLQAAEADYLFAQYSLAAGVARAYFIAIEAGEQEAIAAQSVDALENIARIVDIQYKNGLASAQDPALAKTDLASAKDSLAAIGGAKRDAIRALEILLGRYPGADLGVAASLPAAPAPPNVGIPSQVLERRPDLVSAERTVAAAFNQRDAAKAATLPAISLTSTIGGASGQLTNLLDPANVAWTVAGNLVAPLFDGGLRKSRVEQASAEQRQAIAAYGQAALDAFGEVENALDQGEVLQRRQAAVNEAAQQAGEAFRIVQLRYNEGETDLIDVLTIQQRVFSAQSNRLSVLRLLLEQRVNLHLALGGDWQSASE